MMARVRLGTELGQPAAEYLGVLVLVSVIIAAVASTDVGDRLRALIGQQICAIDGDGDDACGRDRPSRDAAHKTRRQPAPNLTYVSVRATGPEPDATTSAPDPADLPAGKAGKDPGHGQRLICHAGVAVLDLNDNGVNDYSSPPPCAPRRRPTSRGRRVRRRPRVATAPVALPGRGQGGLLVADGRRALVGSANLTHRALTANLEAGVLIEDASVAGELEDHVRSLMSIGVLAPL